MQNIIANSSQTIIIPYHFIITKKNCVYLLYGAKRLVNEFPAKGWKVRGLNKLLKRLREHHTRERQLGSGRPRTARTQPNIDTVNELVLSQEDAPQSHRTTRQIFRETGIPRSSVSRIVHKDLRLKCLIKRRAQELSIANRDARHVRAGLLLQKYPASAVDFIFFQRRKGVHCGTTRQFAE